MPDGKITHVPNHQPLIVTWTAPWKRLASLLLMIFRWFGSRFSTRFSSFWSRFSCAQQNCLPSGKHTKSYGKLPFIVDFPIKNGGSFHSKMLVHQRVNVLEHLLFPTNIDPELLNVVYLHPSISLARLSCPLQGWYSQTCWHKFVLKMRRQTYENPVFSWQSQSGRGW